MNCSNCGASAAPDQRFCGQCGTPLASGCPTCGTENPPGNKFCGSCGTALGATEAATPAEQATAPATIATERRVVSVLFVDLVGFTSFSEGRDPEDVRALITQYFDLAKEAVDHFGGTVDKYIGDAVMAWWGAQTSNEDDAERAVRAALEIVDRVTALGERVGLPDLAARAGVMTGEASVGPGGNDKGLLLGDLVNSASRVQSLADDGSVLVGDTTATLARDVLELEPAGTHIVKGKDEPITAWRAVRVRGAHYRPERDVLEPPFVGRDPELRTLKDNLHATDRDGRARLVSLVGQAGIGKSRLIWEFLKYIDGLADTIYWHEGRSPSYGDGVAMWALGEMIRRRAAIQETDDDATSRGRLAATLETYLDDPEERAWVEPRLATVLGVGESVGTERTELFAAARALFEGISRQGTTVLVFEDVQWADPSLLEFIEELPDWSQNHPILVVTVTRPDLLDRRPDWGSGRRGFTSVYLSPLAPAEMTALIEGAAPGIPDDAVGRIADAAGGVPLFAVEMLRMLLGDGRLELEDGRARVVGDVSDLQVPDSVQAIIAARLDRLPVEEREVARDAAVLGFSFTLEGLAAVREEEPDKVERQLAGLVRHEILELIRDPRSPEAGQYQWVQAMLREVAYGRIAKSDRHELHTRAARYFRDLADPELAPIAASHFVWATEAGPGDEALEAELVEALHAAIERAQDLHAHEQVIALVDTALPVVPADLEPELRERATRAAVRLADGATADRHVQALIEQGRAGDVERLHLGIALLGRVGNEMSRSTEVVEPIAEHLANHTDLTAHPALAKAAVSLARARMLTGAGDELVAAEADAAIGAAEHLGLLEEVADAMITRGTALSPLRIHQGIALIRGAIQLCREHGFTDTLLRGLINLGYASRDADETLEATEEAFRESKRVGDRNRASFVAGNLIGIYDWLWDLDGIGQVLEDPALSDAIEVRIGMSTARADRLEYRGEHDRARELRQWAVDHLAEVSDVQTQLNVERSLWSQHWIEQDFEACWDLGVRHFEGYEFAPWISLAMMSWPSAALRDRDHMDRVIRESAPFGSGSWSSITDVPSVQLLLLDGGTEAAIEAGRQALARMEEAQAHRNRFFMHAILARDLPPGPDRDESIAAALALAETAGATSMPGWVDRFLET